MNSLIFPTGPRGACLDGRLRRPARRRRRCHLGEPVALVTGLLGFGDFWGVGFRAGGLGFRGVGFRAWGLGFGV